MPIAVFLFLMLCEPDLPALRFSELLRIYYSLLFVLNFVVFALWSPSFMNMSRASASLFAHAFDLCAWVYFCFSFLDFGPAHFSGMVLMSQILISEGVQALLCLAYIPGSFLGW